MTKPRILLLAVLSIAVFCVRILPYVLGAFKLTDVTQFVGFLWNYSPISALFLFCGAQFPEKRWAYGAPLAAILCCDVAIGIFQGDMSMGLHPAIPAIYGCYALIVFSGSQLRRLDRWMSDHRSKSPWRSQAQRFGSELLFLAAVASTGVVAEGVFFIITNFASWAVQTGYYPHTWDGLVACYVAGIPFFRNAVESTTLYGVGVFAASALAASWFPALGTPRVAAESTQPAAA